MAVYMLSSQFLGLGGVDRSAHIKGVTLAVDVDQLDTTDMASLGWKEAIGGLKAGTLNIEFQDDAVDASIDDILWALLGTVTTFEIRSTSAVVGVNNAKYTGSTLVSTLSFGGQVGELAKKSVSWPTSGAVTRAEA